MQGWENEMVKSLKWLTGWYRRNLKKKMLLYCAGALCIVIWAVGPLCCCFPSDMKLREISEIKQVNLPTAPSLSNY